MRRSTILLLCFVLASFAQGQSTSHQLDSVVSLYFQNKSFNGTVLVAQKGTLLLEKGYGYKDVDAKTKTDVASLYQYGSVTKQFTAALIIYLQEKGKLNIHDKLSKYFPDLPYADSVTIYNLLTHTSGIYNYTNNGDFMQHDAVKPATPEKIMSLFRNHPLEFPPGSKFSYSNSGYSLLGYIIEKVSGKPYETLVRQIILKPFGMSTAGFDFAHNASPDRTTGYSFINGDKAGKAGIIDSSVAFSAGSLYGSVQDLYAWHQAMQKGKLLTAASWKQMYTPYLSHYAFGLSVDSLYGRLRIGHNGGIFGYTSSFKRFPQEDVVVIVLSNNSSPKVDEIADKLSGLVFGQTIEWPKLITAVSLPDEKLKPFVGEYEVKPGFTVVMRIDEGVLKAKPTGEPEVELSAKSETDFYVQAEDVTVSFQRDSTGAVTGFSFVQNGQTVQAKKIK